MNAKHPLFAVAILGAALLFSCKEDTARKAPEGQVSADIVKNPYTASGTDTGILNTMAVLKVDGDSVHDFGALKEGDVVTHKFAIQNTGKGPLVISSAEGSCGCTVGDYPRGPVPPGGKAEITVRFNSAGKPGHQEKSLAILSNAQGGAKTLYITADVSPQ